MPEPVSKYLKWALTEGQPTISEATFVQSGRLRTDSSSERWMDFTAIQKVSASTPGFVWNAKVKIAGPLHVRVLDSYIRGVGSGAVRLLSVLTVGNASNAPELNSGALHRYLAEAVWYPTALLPSAGVQWSAIDNQRALATLRDHGVEVSLEFRFAPEGQVIGIYSPGRWGSFNGEYKQVAWEGRFADYQTVQGMQVPSKGEVGWYTQEKWAPVWQGEVLRSEYSFEESK
ncbi:MAG: hypothetical protein OM95_15890 [Bdellovibrio sp. ArHS]|nr:MAG: hypothetical protein OM95_15890 [Bdellovibrio sp. ArHS]